MNFKRGLALGLSAFIGIFGLYLLANAVTWVGASDIVMIQSPLDGTLRPATEPGPTWQGWGTMTTYSRRVQLVFRCDGTRDATGKCSGTDTSIQVRFNDGGHAWVSGQISWEMPLATDALVKLHKEFGSVDAIDRQLVLPAINKAFYQTSPLMSSTENYAARRTEFLELFQDQLKNGVYKTRTVDVKEPDPITGEMKTVSKVELLMDKDGNPTRSEPSSMGLYKISMLPATISEIYYDPEVEKQIKTQRDAILNVQTAQANAKKAEQDAITAQKSGEALAAEARAKQEAVKATAVVQAEQAKDVATLKAQQERDVAKLGQEAAGYTKQQNILLGEGEAERKRLVMSADGALAQKLDAYVKVNELYANAFAAHQGPLVPSVVMGGNGGAASAAGGVQNLMDLFALKAAKDLSLDLSVPNVGGKVAAR